MVSVYSSKEPQKIEFTISKLNLSVLCYKARTIIFTLVYFVVYLLYIAKIFVTA